MIAVDLVPESWQPAFVDLAVLVPLLIGLGTIVLAAGRWHVRWLRGQIVGVIRTEIAGVREVADRVDRAVNRKPDGAPTIAQQVDEHGVQLRALRRSVAELTVAGWRRSERTEELAGLVREVLGRLDQNDDKSQEKGSSDGDSVGS